MASYLNLLLLALPVSASVPETPETITPSAQPAHYVLDDKPGDLEALIFYDRETLAASMAHDHVITASKFTGTVLYESTNPSTCDVNIGFFVSDLSVDVGNARGKYNFPDQTSESNKAGIKKNMLSKSQLDGKSFSKISFQSSSCTPSGEKVIVTGALSVHGFTHAVNVPMTISADGQTFSASGKFTAQHSDFGMTPYSAMLGALKNAPQIVFHINVRGQAK